ncbi:MAG: glycosylase [Ginsengibacter sp.]
MQKNILFLLLAICLIQCGPEHKTSNTPGNFPNELVHFTPYKKNPVFGGTGKATWDMQIRERGYILKEQDNWYLWYTGYVDINDTKYLGYATSPDGISWSRYQANPIYNAGWVEDMCVVKDNGIYYMFAEGKGDTAHLLTSTDRIHWTEKGNLDIRRANGEPIEPGPFGTPAVFKEGGLWYLFYERNDSSIWLATSADLKTWTNVRDEAVLERGPEKYDQYGVAMNQVIKYKGLYYGYYHATAFQDWSVWSTNVAVSKDLIHWKKYQNNPIIDNDKSSGILVNDGKQFRLYTMHPEVDLFFPVTDGSR